MLIILRDSRGVINHYSCLPEREKWKHWRAKNGTCGLSVWSHNPLVDLWLIMHPTPEGMHLSKQLYISTVEQRMALKLLPRLHNHQFISEIPLCEMHTVSLNSFWLTSEQQSRSFLNFCNTLATSRIWTQQESSGRQDKSVFIFVTGVLSCVRPIVI